MAVRTRRDVFPVETHIDTQYIVPTSRLVSGITGFPVQPNKAIVGANAFAHESGIHQDGILKFRETYEIMKAEDVGWTTNKLSLGKLSGARHWPPVLRSWASNLTARKSSTMYLFALRRWRIKSAKSLMRICRRWFPRYKWVLKRTH